MAKINNEQRVLSFLVRHFKENYSINQLAKLLGLTPKGMHKLLRRLEQQDIVRPKKMANAIFYQINFESDLACKTAELALFEEIKMPYARAQTKDMERLRPVADAAVLFGSILEKGEKAKDIDLLVVFEKNRYNYFQKELNKLQAIKTKKIHLVMQTPEDLVKNLQKPDEVILEIIKKGKILWGHQIIVNVVKEAVK